MANGALVWDKTGERFYETGVDRGVLYPYKDGDYSTGVAWNGLTSVNENPSGAEATKLYADNIKYLNLLSSEEFAFTIEAYTTPDEFDECDGQAQLVKGVRIGQQSRNMFGFSYRTKIGNDTDGDAYGYEIHICYGCLASPSSKTHSTVNENPEAVTLSYEVNTTPVNVAGFKPTAHMIINSNDVTPEQLKKIEDALYGSESTEPGILTPDKLVALLGE